MEMRTETGGTSFVLPNGNHVSVDQNGRVSKQTGEEFHQHIDDITRRYR